MAVIDEQNLWVAVLARAIADDVKGDPDARMWLTARKYAEDRRMVCAWAGVDENVLRLYTARRAAGEGIPRGLDIGALKKLATGVNGRLTTCVECGTRLERTQSKFCSVKCEQRLRAREKYRNAKEVA